jgi:hypothetical protein
MYKNDNSDIVRIIKEILNNDEETQKTKESADDILEKQKLQPIPQTAYDLLTKISKSSQTWNNIFNAIEDLRKNFRNAGSLDASADQRQIGMASVLLVLFELVVQTNLRIQPVDVNIIINTIVDNFTKESQVKALEEFVEILNIK